MNTNQIELLRSLVEDLEFLRSELDGKVEVRILERIESAVQLLKHIEQSRDGPREILKLLGIIVECLPSVVKMVDILIDT